jgi:hypothetical protein
MGADCPGMAIVCLRPWGNNYKSTRPRQGGLLSFCRLLGIGVQVKHGNAPGGCIKVSNDYNG